MLPGKNPCAEFPQLGNSGNSGRRTECVPARAINDTNDMQRPLIYIIYVVDSICRSVPFEFDNNVEQAN